MKKICLYNTKISLIESIYITPYQQSDHTVVFDQVDLMSITTFNDESYLVGCLIVHMKESKTASFCLQPTKRDSSLKVVILLRSNWSNSTV